MDADRPLSPPWAQMGLCRPRSYFRVNLGKRWMVSARFASERPGNAKYRLWSPEVSTSEIWDAARRLTIGSDEGFQDRLNTWGQTVSRYVKTRRDLEGFAKKSPETLTTQDLVEIVHLKEIERGLEGRLQGYTTWGETLGEAAQTQSLRKRISDTSQVLSYRETGLPRAPVAGGVETILDQTPKGLRKTIKTGPDTYRVERRTTKEGSPATKSTKLYTQLDQMMRFTVLFMN